MHHWSFCVKMHAGRRPLQWQRQDYTVSAKSKFAHKLSPDENPAGVSRLKKAFVPLPGLLRWHDAFFWSPSHSQAPDEISKGSLQNFLRVMMQQFWKPVDCFHFSAFFCQFKHTRYALITPRQEHCAVLTKELACATEDTLGALHAST